MNKKGFAISVVLYSMVILVIGIFYLLLGIVRNRYMVGDTLKEAVINSIGNFFPEKDEILKDIIESQLPLTDADGDGTRFVYGAAVDNYVWYSGKLWRIVSIDKNGNIKLVTQGNMTTITWDLSDTNTDYSTSQIRIWLNNEFLPTLYDADNLLINSVWDYTKYSSFPSSKLSTTNTVTNEKVGLLNIYEFMMTNGKDSFATDHNTFLDNGYNWFTISPKEHNSYIWYITHAGGSSYYDSISARHGVRPAINLKSGVMLLGGTGKKSDPYIIQGDKVMGATAELLNNRISGEYINFNNIKYRIVGTEEINGQKLTKVTMADYSLNGNAIVDECEFGSGSSDVIYNINKGIGKYLLDWYNADETSTTYASTYIEETYKNMIATVADGIKWYIGPRTSTRDYTLSKTGTTVETPIGLGYYGEIFSSQFGDGSTSSKATWLITNTGNTAAMYIRADGRILYQFPFAGGISVRPFFYLKSDVKIGDIDGDGVVGTGMPHDPYEIIQ